MWRPLLGDRGRITKHSVCHCVILIFVFVRQKYFGEVFLRPPPSPAAPWVLYFTLKLTHYASISTVVLLVTFWHYSHSTRRESVRPSVRLSVPSFARITPLQRFCCWAPCRQEISIDSGSRQVPETVAAGRPTAAAPQHGAQQQMRAVSRWQLT